MMHNLSSMSFERTGILRLCLEHAAGGENLYPDAAQRTEMLRRHASFYNTEPQIGAIVNGMALGLREEKPTANRSMVKRSTPESRPDGADRRDR